MSKLRIMLVSVLALGALFIVAGPASAQSVTEIQDDTLTEIDDAFAEVDEELVDDDFGAAVDDDFFDYLSVPAVDFDDDDFDEDMDDMDEMDDDTDEMDDDDDGDDD